MSRLGIITLTLLPLALMGCGSEDESANGENNTEVESFARCAEEDLALSPFAGPGYDPDLGLIGPARDTYVASSTWAVLGTGARPQFDQYAQPIVDVLPTQPGLVGFSWGLSAKCNRGRTLTVWESEQALMDFVVGDAHGAAMLHAGEIMIGAAVTHWEVQEVDVPLLWEAAHAKLAEIEPRSTVE